MQRRAILAMTGLGIGGVLSPVHAQMQAQTNDAIRRLVGTAEPQAGRVTIRAPNIEIGRAHV